VDNAGVAEYDFWRCLGFDVFLGLIQAFFRPYLGHCWQDYLLPNSCKKMRINFPQISLLQSNNTEFEGSHIKHFSA
jgi:hypothetical protein